MRLYAALKDAPRAPCRPRDSDRPMDARKLEILPHSLSISFKRHSTSAVSPTISADELFSRFVSANSCYFWNLNLKEVLASCRLVGSVKPYCLLIGGADISIQAIKIAYRKRLLKAPDAFYINYCGDVEPVQCQAVLPSQFVSLDESLCYIIYDLNLNCQTSSFDMICSRLAEWYPSLQLPPQFLILATLRSLLDAGQVYYNGYGYNIMTNDKLLVAHWLGQNSPDKSAEPPDPNTSGSNDNRALRSNSLSDVSVGDGLADSQANPRNKSAQTHRNHSRTMPVASFPTANIAPVPSSPPAFFNGTEQVVKRTKTRSAVRQFFSKLKPRPHKSRPTSETAADPNLSNLYDDDSSYYAYLKSQPVVFTSSMDFASRLAPKNSDLHTKTNTSQNHQWLWNTSLQSLSNLNSSLSCRKSISSHSKLSTQAIHDDSPSRNVSTSTWSRHNFKDRYSRHRDKSVYSSKTDRSNSRECKPVNYLIPDPPQDDSGVHSISGSHGRVTSDRSTKPKRHTSHYRHKSAELEPDMIYDKDYLVTPSNLNYESKTCQRLTRSFSSRLSGLNPVVDGSKNNSQDSRRVMFREHSGTIY